LNIFAAFIGAGGKAETKSRRDREDQVSIRKRQSKKTRGRDTRDWVREDKGPGLGPRRTTYLT